MKKQENFEGRVLLVLSLMLVSVFFFSVYMYDDLERSAESGRMQYIAASVREFIDTNEVVSAFFGIEEDEETDVDSEAMAYILRYNEIYENLK